jgi:hypothetical protein
MTIAPTMTLECMNTRTILMTTTGHSQKGASTAMITEAYTDMGTISMGIRRSATTPNWTTMTTMICGNRSIAIFLLLFTILGLRKYPSLRTLATT